MAFQTTGIVNLSFNANVSQARQQLQSLQTQLQQIVNLPLNFTGGAGLTKQITEASQAAMSLKTHLQNATNLKTGNLDFTKLNASLQQSGMSLSQYGQKLMAIGPQGQKAFMNIASAITQAEIPLRRINPMMTQLMTTFKNTLRYQLSASMIRGLVSGVREAFTYTKDLNKSLNDIRIVTGKNIDEMTRFAAEANKAAKALSTTTTEYTKASLIYYQQGLDATEAQKRADVTVKMANVVGESAQSVSNQLTAVWNNFYDGSKSLEYFADVMTALGAATASSTNEIATGLEKFAAIANTVGLSYEYATAALATVTAETRQSADVVGTAFKTLFARIQDLELGKTLDDGTTLGKYSQALDAVGINIKGANGELKEMDTILNEMGNKWSTLSKDTQVALAQTVGGTRQYAQLLALMDNWDKFQTNLNTAYGATGTLQEQADIYAESWEAAKKRVKASLETLYSSLIDEKFFIGLFNTLEKVLKVIDTVVDSMGGMKGVLSTLGVLATKVFGDQIANGLRNMAMNMKMQSQWGVNQMQQLKSQQVKDIANTMALGASKAGDPVGSAAAKQYEAQLRLQSELAANEKNMDATQLANAKQLLDIHRQIGEQVIQAKEKQEQLKITLDGIQTKIYDQGLAKGTESWKAVNSPDDIKKLTNDYQAFKGQIEATINAETKFMDALQKINSGANLSKEEINSLEKAFTSAGQGAELLKNVNIQEWFNKLRNGSTETKTDLEAMLELLKLLETQGTGGAGFNKWGIETAQLRELIETLRQKVQAEQAASDAEIRANQIREETIQMIQMQKQSVKDWATSITAGAQALMSFGSILSSLSSLVDTWSNPDLSGWEKFVRTITTGSMALMMTISMFNALTRASSMWQAGTLKNVAAGAKNIVMTKLLTVAQKENERATRKNIAANITETTTNAAEGQQAKKTAMALDVEALSQERVAAATNANAGSNIVATSTGRTGKLGRRTAWNTRAWNNASDAQKVAYAEKAGYEFKNNQWYSKKSGNVAATSTVAAAGSKEAGAAAAKSLGAVAAKAGLLIAAIATIIALIVTITSRINQFEKAAKKATEAANATAEAYQKVSEAYNTFTSNVSAYEEAKAGLEGLTKGTVEYREAVLKANEAALQLLNTYDNLEYEYRDGVIEITESSLEEAQKQQLETMEQAQISNQIAQKVAQDAQLADKKQDLARKQLHAQNEFWINFGNNQALAVGAGLAGGAVGTMIAPGWGTLIGAIAGSVTGAAGGALYQGGAFGEKPGVAQQSELEALEKLANIYEHSGAAAFADFDKLLGTLELEGGQKLIDSLKENKDEVIKLAKEMANNTKAQIEANKQIVETGLSDTFDNLGVSKRTEEAITNNLARGLEYYSKSIYEDSWKKKNGTGKYSDAEVQKAYAKAMGWDVSNIDNKTGNKATYYDKQGNAVAEDLSDDVARRYLAQQEALESMGVAAKELAKLFEDLDTEIRENKNATNEATLALQAFRDYLISGNFYESSRIEVDALKQEIDTNQDKEFTQDEIIAYFNKHPEVAWKSFGATKEEAADNMLQELITGFDNFLENITVGLSTEAQNLFNTLDKNYLQTVGGTEQSSIANLIDQAILTSGKAAGEDVVKFYNKAKEDMDKVANVFKDVDFTNTTVADLQNLLKDANIEVEYSTEELAHFIDAMVVDITDSVETFTTYWEQQKSLVKELNAGDVIKPEEYNKLMDEAKQYFTLMADGTYKLVVAGKTLNDTVDSILISNLGIALTDAKAEVERLNHLQGLKDQESDILKNLNKYHGLSYQGYVEMMTGGELTIGSGGILQTTREGQNYYYDANAPRDANGQVIANRTKFQIYDGNTWDQAGEQNILWELVGPAAYDAVGLAANTQIPLSDNNIKILEAQLDIIEADSAWMSDSANQRLLSTWRAGIEYGNLTYQQAESIYNTANRLFEQVTESVSEDQAQAELELQNLYEASLNEFDTSVARKAFVDAQKLQEDDVGWDQLMIANDKAMTAAMEAEAWEGLNQEEVAQYAEHLVDTFGMAHDEATEVARATMKMNNGIEELNSNWEEWNSILKESSKSSAEYSKAMLGVRKALSNVLDVSEEFIDIDFVESAENLELIGKAAEGDAEAIDELGNRLAKDIILDEIQLTGKNLFDINGISTSVDDVLSMVDELFASLNNKKFELGKPVDDQQFIDTLNSIITATGMTVETANALFRTMGFTPTYEEQDVTSPGGYVTVNTIHHYREGYDGADDDSWTEYEHVESKQIPTGGDSKVLQGLGIITPDGKSADPEFKIKKATVSKLTYTGGGAMNNLSSINKGGKKSGGGSSKKEKKNINDEKERYHEINEVLDDLKREYDAIATAKDRAFGKTRLSYIDQEIKKQKELTEAQKQYLAEIDGYLESDKDIMRTKYGATFDTTGRITNYDELVEANVNAYNNAVEQFNAGIMSEEQFEGYEKAYEQFVKDMDLYEETLNLREEQYIEYLNNLNNEIDLQLEKVNYTVELNIELNEDDLKLIEFMISNLGNSAEEATDKLEKLTQGLLLAEQNIGIYKKGIRETLKINDQFTDEEINSILNGTTNWDTIFEGKTLTQDQVETIREYRDGLIESVEAMENYKTQVEEGVLGAFDKLNERMEQTNSLLEHQRTIVQGFKDIIDLVGADNLGISEQALKKMQDSTVALAKTQVATSKTILDTRKHELASAQDELDKAIANSTYTDPEQDPNVKYWRETVGTITESVNEAEEEFMSSWSDALQAAADAFQASVEQTIKNFEKAMSGAYGTLEALQEAFDRSKELNEFYLEDYEKIYNLSKLNREVEKSISDTNSVNAKIRLRDIQEEILEMQESGAEVTQYEVDALRAKYELRLAEIALEEAQNAKSQVRMNRDSEGNWSYIYTADENAVDNAQQNYEDKLYAYQNLTQGYIQDIQERLMAIPSALSEAIAKINSDMTLSEDERQKKIKETIEFQRTMYGRLVDQLGISMEDAEELYDIDWAKYSELTGYKISADENWIDSWDETSYAQLTGFQTMEEAQGQFVASTEQMMIDLNIAWSEYQLNIEGVMDAAGTSVGNFATTVDEKLDIANTAADETKDKLTEMGDAGATAFETLATESGEWLTNYQKNMAGYRTEIEKQVAALNELLNKYAEVDRANQKMGESYEEEKDNGGAKAGTPVSTGDTNGTTNGKGIIDDEKIIKYKAQYYDVFSASWKDMGKNFDSIVDAETAATSATNSTLQNWVNQGRRNLDISAQKKMILSKITPVYLDTGGYTGTWDSTGRLAVLHQKELVLNAHDTENFLSAVNILRDIAQVIDLRASAQAGFLGQLAQTTVTPIGNQVLEQEVTIHAEFPNATDRNEIQEAFNTLLNHASQFANRKN